MPYVRKVFRLLYETLEKVYTNLLEGYGELNYTHIDIEAMENPDRVLVRSGVDIELKGKEERYQNELIGIFEFEQGKVKSFWEYLILSILLKL